MKTKNLLLSLKYVFHKNITSLSISWPLFGKSLRAICLVDFWVCFTPNSVINDGDYILKGSVLKCWNSIVGTHGPSFRLAFLMRIQSVDTD